MINIENRTDSFRQGLSKLGFVDDDALFFVDSHPKNDFDVLFHIYQAEKFGATAVYLRKQMNGSYKPQVYLYDGTKAHFNQHNEGELADIQKKLWTSGEVPLACIFYDTDVSILDCTRPVNVQNNEFKPEYLVNRLNLANKAHKLYNEQFAVKIKSGIFWEEEENKNKFKFQNNSSYDVLIKNIRDVEDILINKLQDKNVSKDIVTKIIVQSILIKYLEERTDNKGNRLLSEKYFQKYENAQTFGEVLKKGRFVELLEDLNDKKTGFNGNVFEWADSEKETLKKLDLSIVAELLATEKRSISSPQQEINFSDRWRYFEFRYIPVELISRLYEEFLGEDKQNKGLYYTPAHLAKLLVDECLPLKRFNEIDLMNFNILDPACGSGIFLVLVFKRLVQIWKLQNNLKAPSIEILKSLLQNIYGVDVEPQAIRLASFSLSLALCDELEPMQIINKLQFDDLRKDNLIKHNFFTCDKIKNKKFDLVIGNPPYIRGGTKDFTDNITLINNEKIEVPNNQIALKFLGDSFCYLKPSGLQCLLVKSSGVLYNSTSHRFIKILFSETNVIQVLDFTALARNRSLWDNKKKQITLTSDKETPLEVETAAIFIKNEKPDFTRNILHLTFRRTKSTKERIFFEIDDYDLHFVNRQNAKNNIYFWKNNLLGGGRIKNTIEKLLTIKNLEQFCIENNIVKGEGAGGAKSLPNAAFNENKINSSFLTQEYYDSFEGKKNKNVYAYPNFLIKENIDLPFCKNDEYIKFSNEIVGLHTDNINLLNQLKCFFKQNHDILKFFNICTSGKMLVYKNTACKQEDILSLPIDLDLDFATLLSDYDFNIISDVNNVMQLFLRNGENSIAVKPIKQKDFKQILEKYGTEFSKVLNLIYEANERKFRLSDVIALNNSLIVTVFKYDSSNEDVDFKKKNLSELNIESLTDNKISTSLSANRIIKLYPQKDTIVFVKPNQYRYWLSLIAYRDADRCFADFADAGF